MDRTIAAEQMTMYKHDYHWFLVNGDFDTPMV